MYVGIEKVLKIVEGMPVKKLHTLNIKITNFIFHTR